MYPTLVPVPSSDAAAAYQAVSTFLFLLNNSFMKEETNIKEATTMIYAFWEFAVPGSGRTFKEHDFRNTPDTCMHINYIRNNK
ncbi:unnamed protein product [Brugia timori]|uniref:COesterase domain-containing protein n=1 Tax=Brugia timori TaxID=42155 RepID=A0A0R3QAY0_9BILA|nr:unnamed protein product [Brugia timori]